MTTRNDVERLAQEADNCLYTSDIAVPYKLVRELCRAWLALDAAPVVDVTDCNNPKRKLPNSPHGITWDDFPTIKCRIVLEPATPASGGPRDGN